MFESFLKPSLSFPTLTGSIVTFNSQYALPLKSHTVDIDSVSGVNALNIMATGKNLWGNGITLSNSTISGTYIGYGMKYKSNIRMVLFDKDTSQDIRGIFLGFTGTGTDASGGIQWIISNGTIFSEGNIFSETYKYISIYPGTQATLDKIFARFYVLTVIDSGDYSDYVPYVGEYTKINIGQTVNEGEYNARTGVLEVTQPSVQTIQLPPCPIDTLEGENNIWADTGDTTLSYITIG